MQTHPTERSSCDLEKPCRNLYYFGQLLDVHHLRLETEYFNSMRRLHNRLIPFIFSRISRCI